VKQSSGSGRKLDSFVARAPRNDERSRFRKPLNVIASEDSMGSG
jgi:hypothetical protein